MTIAALFKQYVQELFIGRRAQAREIIFNALDRGVTAPTLLTRIIWVAMEQVEHLYRQHEISRVTEHMATRINRSIADQLQAHLPPEPKTGKRMVIISGDGELAELGAQIIADLFGAQGWSVWFLGSGVASDEVLELISGVQADILCLYGSQPKELPAIRCLIETIREIGAHDNMQILVSGGVFNRAEGLGDELKADLFAPDIEKVLMVVENHPVRVPKPDIPEPGRRRKRKKRQAPAATRKTMKRRKRATAKV